VKGVILLWNWRLHHRIFVYIFNLTIIEMIINLVAYLFMSFGDTYLNFFKYLVGSVKSKLEMVGCMKFKLEMGVYCAVRWWVDFGRVLQRCPLWTERSCRLIEQQISCWGSSNIAVKGQRPAWTPPPGRPRLRRGESPRQTTQQTQKFIFYPTKSLFSFISRITTCCNSNIVPKATLSESLPTPPLASDKAPSENSAELP